jgi:hypothetical protein
VPRRQQDRVAHSGEPGAVVWWLNRLRTGGQQVTPPRWRLRSGRAVERDATRRIAAPGRRDLRAPGATGGFGHRAVVRARVTAGT